jgi:tRNA(fMet)-specific endonuclease VapC
VKFLLDTDTVSYFARGASALLVNRMNAMAPQNMAISVITRGEIEFGLVAHPPKKTTVTRMRGLFDAIATLPLQPQAALYFSTLRHTLARAGKPIGAYDLWIAAHALAENLVLVTNNEREFHRVPGLAVENWTR